jgi:hypothetical protein
MIGLLAMYLAAVGIIWKKSKFWAVFWPFLALAKILDLVEEEIDERESLTKEQPK